MSDEVEYGTLSLDSVGDENLMKITQNVVQGYDRGNQGIVTEHSR